MGKKGLEILKSKVEGANLTSLNPQLITYSIPAATMKMSKARGGNALGLDVKGHLVSKSYPLAPLSLLPRGDDVMIMQTQSDNHN